MPTIFINENGKKTDFDNASFAIIGTQEKEEKLIVCPLCKKKKKESEFISDVCLECNEKIVKNPKVAHSKKRSVERTGHI